MKDQAADICFIDVSRRFKTGLFKYKQALNQLSFSVEKGEVVGLIGPNGSGKSTSLKLLLGFLKPNKGEVLVCGKNPRLPATRSLIGYLPENPRFQKFLTARQILSYYGLLLDIERKKRLQRIEELLELVNLKHAQNERVWGFSKGMVQRLAIAQSLLSEPRILAFDEPMSGVDPLGRIEIRALIRQIQDKLKEVTIFFSSHILSDVEEICSSVMLLRNGSLIRQCSVQALLGADRQKFEIVVDKNSVSPSELKAAGIAVRETPMGVCVPADGVDRLADNLSLMKKTGGKVLSVSAQRPNLEKALFGEAARAGT